MSEPALVVSGVEKSYRGLRALDGVSFAIERGELFGLLGPNGAGKSTLIGIAAGLVRADRGSVRVLGHDVVEAPRAARRALGVVPQELVFDPFFTVREVLSFQAGYFGVRQREAGPRIEELLVALQLSDKADANMRTLSGGMKRRVLIAQALVHRPPVVVLDEPTEGVDLELRRALWSLFRRMVEQGTTILLTTHHLDEAEELCGRIAILKGGAIAALDTKERLLLRATGRSFSVTARGALPDGLSERLPSPARIGPGARIELEIDRENSLGAALEALRNAGVEVEDVRRKDRSLEQVFLEITAQRPAE
jgi:ABC-2 type transport system ATP-binding protein